MSSTEQQREMSKGKVLWRTRTHDGECFMVCLACTSWASWNNREVVQVKRTSIFGVFVGVAVVVASGDGVFPYSLYKLYRYVRPQRVWFLSSFGLKTDINHFVLKVWKKKGYGFYRNWFGFWKPVGRFRFVRSGRPDRSVCKQNIPIWWMFYPSPSNLFKVACTIFGVIIFQDWKMTHSIYRLAGLAGQFWQMKSTPQVLKWVRILEVWPVL